MISNLAYFLGCAVDIWVTHGVEGQEPETLQERVFVPEAGRGCSWRLAQEDGNAGPDGKDPKTKASASATADSMAHRDTENLTKEIPSVPEDERRFPSLREDIFEAVNSRGECQLRPHYEDEGQIVDPSVNSV